MEISTLSGPSSQLPSLTAAGDSVATAQNCCDSESPACSPTHSPAAPGRPSARPGQTLSRPPLGGQPQGLAQLELPSLRADCDRDCGPGPGPGPALSDSESVAATAQSNCPTRSRRDRCSLAAAARASLAGWPRRRAAAAAPRRADAARRRAAAARRTMRCLQAKCTTILRCSGRKGDLVYVQSGAPTRGHSFKQHKSEPIISLKALA